MTPAPVSCTLVRQPQPVGSVNRQLLTLVTQGVERLQLCVFVLLNAGLALHVNASRSNK